MDNLEFKSLLIKEEGDKNFSRQIVTKNIDDLPQGDVVINVKYSSLNYKDALSSIGNKGVTRNYPHTPGIDAAGIVMDSSDVNLKKGDEVLITGYDLGMNTSGGYGQFIRVPAEWVVKLPKNLSLKESMIFGTAGFTAALSVYKLTEMGNVMPEDGEILITGATGGVGSTAVSLLGKLGYDVIGATGKASQKDMLISIGAKDIVDRKEVDDDSGKPMLRSKWAGVVDTVGGNNLSTAIKTTNYGGCVTTCGNVAGHKFDASVYPFILKGITLYGIDSVQCPRALRLKIWDLLANDWKTDTLHENVNEVSLEELSDSIDQILEGKLKGRTIVNLDK